MPGWQQLEDWSVREVMNSNKIFPARRTFVALSLIGLGAVLLTGAGCGRRPIVVQAAPATIIQTSAPTPPPAIATPSDPAPAVIVMKEAPPPPRFEQATPQPSSDAVWIPGYWYWRDGQQQWVAGHWDVPPRVGATWVAPRWEKRGDEYIFIQGYWQ